MPTINRQIQTKYDPTVETYPTWLCKRIYVKLQNHHIQQLSCVIFRTLILSLVKHRREK